MLIAGFNYGEPFIAEIVPLEEAQKYTNEDLRANRYRGSRPNSQLEEKYHVIWLTGNSYVYSPERLTHYSTRATVHYEWKKKLHQSIIYATEFLIETIVKLRRSR